MSLVKKHSLFTSIIILSLFLRLYRVSSTPHDLYVDEVAIGWNAYSILKTGRDEYGTFMPLTFRSYDDYKPPLYIYLTSVTMAIVGKNALAVRLPAVIAGTLTVMVFTKLVFLLTRSRKLSLICGLFLAIAPWHLHFSRAGFETTLALFLLTFGAYAVLKAIIRNMPIFFWIGTISLIASLYAYHSARAIVPLLLILAIQKLHIEALRYLRDRHTKPFILFTLIILIPLIFHLFTAEAWTRAGTVSWINKNTSLIKIGEQIGRHTLSYFSTDFLFFAGDQIGRHSVREMGMLYIWQFPWLVFGVYIEVKKRMQTDMVFIVWILLSLVAPVLTAPNPHALRALPLVIPLTYFTVRGIIPLVNKYPAVKTALIIIVPLSLAYYLHLYYYHYPKRSSLDWNGGYKAAVQYTLAHEREYQRIALTKSFIKGYAFLYFYGDFDPVEVQKKPNRTAGYGKFVFVNDPLPIPQEKTLYVTEPHIKWNGRLLKTVNNAGGDPVFSIWEN